MKRYLIYIILLLSSMLLAQGTYLEDRIYIKFQSGVDISVRYYNEGGGTIALTGISEIDELNYQNNCSEIERLFTGNDAVLERWYIFYIHPEEITESKQDYEYLIDYVETVDLVEICSVGWVPNDPLFDNTYHKAFFDSKIPNAWDIQQGNSNLLIGIIDNGLDWNHPDISIDNIWQNLGEDYDNDGSTIYIDGNGAKQFDAGDLNGIDDDGNGKIDDLAGFNFVNNNYNIYSNAYSDRHGLNMFGIIAANENNSLGAAGSSFNSKIIHCKAGAGGYIYGYVPAIQYLADIGVDVISMSFFGGPMNSAQDAINYAYNQGAIIIACGGYTTTGCPILDFRYPLAYDNVVGMGILETDAVNIRLNSIVSSKIDLLGSRTATFPDKDVQGQHIYTWSMHTSGSTAMTAGILSLLKAQYPTWTNDQIINQLFITAINKDDYNTTNSCNFDFTGLIGHGLVEAEYALLFNGTVDRDLIWNKDIKVFHSIIVQSGKTLTIKDGTNLSFEPNKTFYVYGNLVIEGDLTINRSINILSGGSMTIQPGAILKFSSGSSLTVNGTLIAQGTSNNKITFMRNGTTGTWGSITFNGSSSSSSILNNAEIKYATDVKCLNGANVIIQNSIIDQCTQGIYIYNSEPQIKNNQITEPVQNGINSDASGLSPLIQNNTIVKSSSNPQYKQYQGIIFYNNTNGYIAQNDIGGFYWGMYIGGGSDAIFTDYGFQTFDKNNRVRDNRYGICAGWGGLIFAGIWNTYGENNSIYNNTTADAMSYQHSEVLAQNNWWGSDGAQTVVDGTSTLDVRDPLTSDPWLSQSRGGINHIVYNGKFPIEGVVINSDSSIFIGILLERQEKILEAILHYKQMISNNTNPDFALGRLVVIKNRYHINNIRDYLEMLLVGEQPYKPAVLTLIAGILIGEDKYDEAIILYNRIINRYPNSYYAVNALFGKFFAALNYKHNLPLAEQLLEELQSLNLLDEDYLIRLQLAENLFNSDGLEYVLKDNYKNQDKAASDIPETYSLSDNYPNPFNPSTSIKFQLPVDGFVTLKIYDILGSEVATLVNEEKVAGKYEVNFNSSDLASGVYIYKIQAGSFINSKKMILLK